MPLRGGEAGQVRVGDTAGLWLGALVLRGAAGSRRDSWGGRARPARGACGARELPQPGAGHGGALPAA